MKHAFTLIEVLVVIGILGIVAVVALPFYLGGSHAADLSGTVQEITAAMRDAQVQSMDQTNEIPWGIHFSNATNTVPFFAVFTGNSYATGTTQSYYRLPATIGFVTSTLAVGSSEDILFAPISGMTSGITDIELDVLSQPALNTTLVIEPDGEVNLGYTYVYVADTGNNRIQKLTSTGFYISQFPISINVVSIAVNANGIYVADNSDNEIWQLSPVGTPLNHFGSPGTGNGQFEGTYQIALDSNGNIYVVDPGNNRVQKFSSSGTYLGQIGCNSGGCPATSTNGQFNGPENMAIDSHNNIYVTDNGNNRVEKFNSSLIYQMQFGICSSGACATSTSTGSVNNPSGVAIDASGNVFISDTSNNRVEKFNSSGAYITQFGCASGACPVGTSSGEFNSPGNLAIDGSGDVYVSDQIQNRVEKFDNNGNYLLQFGCISGACSSGSGNGQFITPQGMTVAVY